MPIAKQPAEPLPAAPAASAVPQAPEIPAKSPAPPPAVQPPPPGAGRGASSPPGSPAQPPDLPSVSRPAETPAAKDAASSTPVEISSPAVAEASIPRSRDPMREPDPGRDIAAKGDSDHHDIPRASASLVFASCIGVTLALALSGVLACALQPPQEANRFVKRSIGSSEAQRFKSERGGQDGWASSASSEEWTSTPPAAAAGSKPLAWGGAGACVPGIAGPASRGRCGDFSAFPSYGGSSSRPPRGVGSSFGVPAFGGAASDVSVSGGGFLPSGRDAGVLLDTSVGGRTAGASRLSWVSQQRGRVR